MHAVSICSDNECQKLNPRVGTFPPNLSGGVVMDDNIQKVRRVFLPLGAHAGLFHDSLSSEGLMWDITVFPAWAPFGCGNWGFQSPAARQIGVISIPTRKRILKNYSKFIYSSTLYSQ